MIDIWYGEEQRFGHLGAPQRWVNILGRIAQPHRLESLVYALNGAPSRPLSVGPDHRRLANPGDFNVEIDRMDLRAGINTLTLTATDLSGERTSRNVRLHGARNRKWPLPYEIDWTRTRAIQDVVQVVDGLWRLEKNGIRVVEPYYDRVLALGDLAWTDYELLTSVTFHGTRVPRRGIDGGAGVIHAALAVRWPGHDEDGRQPRVKWYPLGATAEFRVRPDLESGSWRILGGGGISVEADSGRPIAPGVRYAIKHRVETLPTGAARYRVKLWEAETPEPAAWDLQMEKPPGDIRSGGALLIAHYTEVTFGNIRVTPVG